ARPEEREPASVCLLVGVHVHYEGPDRSAGARRQPEDEHRPSRADLDSEQHHGLAGVDSEVTSHPAKDAKSSRPEGGISSSGQSMTAHGPQPEPRAPVSFDVLAE